MTAPFFSIILPTFNRPAALAACIQAIRQLDYPHDRFEVIVVDDGSPVPVEKSLTESSGGVEVTLLRQINAGPAERAIWEHNRPMETSWLSPTTIAHRLRSG